MARSLLFSFDEAIIITLKNVNNINPFGIDDFSVVM